VVTDFLTSLLPIAYGFLSLPADNCSQQFHMQRENITLQTMICVSHDQPFAATSVASNQVAVMSLQCLR
jgi:hypothetical protein